MGQARWAGFLVAAAYVGCVSIARADVVSPEPSAPPVSDSCVLAPFSPPRRLDFSRLTYDSANQTGVYHVAVTYDVGSFPLYVDGVGEVPSAGTLNIETEATTLTLRCGDQDGPVIRSIVLDDALRDLRVRAAAAASSSTSSVAASLGSAAAAFSVRDLSTALRALANIPKGSIAPETRAEAFLLRANVKAATGDTVGANADIFTAQRVGDRDILTPTVAATFTARADLAKYRLATLRGTYGDAGSAVLAIDVERVADPATRQRVVTAQRSVTFLSLLEKPETALSRLASLLGMELDAEREQAPPPYERRYFATWERDHHRFLTDMEPIFTRVYHTDGANEIKAANCQPDNRALVCVTSRARQLVHHEDGYVKNYDGYLARIRFRIVRWENNAQDDSGKIQNVAVEYAVTERLATSNGLWEPTVGNTHGVESAIEQDAGDAALALRDAILSVQ